MGIALIWTKLQQTDYSSSVEAQLDCCAINTDEWIQKDGIANT